MPRAMSPAMLAALESSLLYPAIFIDAVFRTGHVHIWTGLGSTTWNGIAWQGLGSLIGISGIAEGSNLEARGISLSLSGLDNSLLADTLQEFQVGASVVVYLGLFGGSPLSLLDSPVISWAGQMDQPVFDVGGETATITITCESKMVMHNVSVERRYTQDDQVIDYPGDYGFSFVTSICNQNFYWGRVPTA
jgi:hypothetical protein